MKKCNIGVIGLGRLGYQHALNVTKTTGAVLAAVADGFPAALERAVNDFDVKGYADYKEMIVSPDIDAIVVATPTQTHFPILMDCIATGKPIYFHDCQRDPNGPPPAYVPQSGGLFVDMAIHDLDVARWMMGSEITELYATGAVLKHEYLKELNDIDDGQILLKFENGAIGMIEISRNANNVHDTRTEVIGLEKSVFTGQEQMTPYKVIGDEEITYDMSNWCLGRFKDAYLDEMEAFVSNVLNGKPSEVTAYDGKMGIKLALAATESFRTGKWVKIQ